MKNFHLIVVVGAPGSGKGTLCTRLAQEHGFTHISVGDLLRQIIANEEADEIIQGYVQRGEPLPMEKLLPILKARLDECTAGRTIILDGFPRRLDQAVNFEQAIGEPSTVLFFNCPHDIAKKRVLERNLGRAGDTAEIFERRYKEFLELNPEILDYYSNSKGSGKLVEVDTSGETEASYQKLVKRLREKQELRLLIESQAQPATRSALPKPETEW